MHAPQGVGALYVQRRELLCARCSMAEATSVRAERARKMFPASSLWARPQSWLGKHSRAAILIAMAALRDRLEQTILGEVEGAQGEWPGAPRVYRIPAASI